MKKAKAAVQVAKTVRVLAKEAVKCSARNVELEKQLDKGYDLVSLLPWGDHGSKAMAWLHHTFKLLKRKT